MAGSSGGGEGLRTVNVEAPVGAKEAIETLRRINAKVVWTSAEIARRHVVLEAIIDLIRNIREDGPLTRGEDP